MPNGQLAEDIAGLRQFYLAPENFFHFCDLLGYKDLQVQPHYELCNFITQSKGDGSNRTSNKSNFPLKGNVSRYDRPDIRRLLILDPRGTFKSSIITEAYTVWRLCGNPYLRVLLGSYNNDKAVEFLEAVKSRLTRPEIKSLFGDLSHDRKGVRWSKYEIQLWDLERDEPIPFDKMANGRAIGMETGIASVHCNIFIGDDLVCEQNVKTEEGLEKPKQFVKFMEPIINPGGEMIIVGTRYHYADLYGTLVENGMFDVHLRSAYNEDGSLYFPQRLTHQRLEAERKLMGPYEFSCQYMNDPVTPEDAVFKPDWILERCATRDFPDASKLAVAAFIDPAIGKTKKSDYTAIKVDGMDSAGNVWTLEAIKRKMGVDEMAEEIFRLNARYLPDHPDFEIRFESNVFQGLIKPLVEKIAAEKNIRINNLIPVEHKTNVSKDYRIHQLVKWAANGQLKIHANFDDLINEFLMYPKWHDDLLDATEENVAHLNPPEAEDKRTDAEIMLQLQKEATISHNPGNEPGAGIRFFRGFVA